MKKIFTVLHKIKNSKSLSDFKLIIIGEEINEIIKEKQISNAIYEKLIELFDYEKTSYEKINNDLNNLSVFSDIEKVNEYLNNYDTNHLIFKKDIEENTTEIMDNLNSKIQNLSINEDVKTNLIKSLEIIKKNNENIQKFNSFDKAYLFNEKEIEDKFNMIFLSVILDDKTWNINMDIPIDFIKNYIDLNNLTNNFYKQINLYLIKKGVDYKKNVNEYLDKILSELDIIYENDKGFPNISLLIQDLRLGEIVEEEEDNPFIGFKQTDEELVINKDEKYFFIGDVHGDILPIIHLIKNSKINLYNEEDWKKLHFIFLGDVIDPFNGKNTRVCNHNQYLLLNNIKTRMGICDMHISIFFLLYLTLKGANVYYILGNHDINYAFSNKLFLYLLDCKKQKKFTNLKFYGNLYVKKDNDEKYLINHEPDYYYDLFHIFKYKEPNLVSNIKINKYQDFYENNNNFVITDNPNNIDQYSTNNWMDDYKTSPKEKEIAYLTDGNKVYIGDKNTDKCPIICGHQYVFYTEIFNIKQSGSQYQISETTNPNQEIILNNRFDIISLDYNSSYYKVNTFDEFKETCINNDEISNILIKIRNEASGYIEDIHGNFVPIVDYDYESKRLYDYFQGTKSMYLTHDFDIGMINTNTVYDSGFIYCLLFQYENGNFIKKIIYQPINRSLKIKLGIENAICFNYDIFKNFKNSTNSFLYYNSKQNIYSLLCNINENDETMKWFKLYAYEPIIDGSEGKYTFTLTKNEIYDKNYGYIINDAIFKNSKFIKSEKEFLDNIENRNNHYNYCPFVYNLLKDSNRVDINYVDDFVKKLRYVRFTYNLLTERIRNRERIDFVESFVPRYLKKGGIEQTYKYSLNQLSSTTLTYIIFYKYLVENEKYDNTFISFVCTYIKYLLTKDYEKEENKDKKLFIKELVKFFDGKFNYHYNLQNSYNKKYYKSWYEETPEFKSMFKINANRFINHLDFEHSLYDYTDLYYATLFISKNYYFDVKEIMETIKKNKEKLDNKEYIDVYNIIYKNIKETTLSYLDYDFMFLICHFIVLLYECSVSNKQFEEILEQNDIRATKLFKLIINKFNKENILKDINESEDNYNVIKLCNKILKDNKLIKDKTESKEEKIKDSLDLLDKIKKSIGLESKKDNDYLGLESKKDNDYLLDSQDMYKYSVEDKRRFNENSFMSRLGGSSDEELFKNVLIK